MKLFLKVGILCIMLAVVFKSCGIPLISPSIVGQPAPDFILESLRGENRNLSELRSGKPCIIFFWATWCPHCRSQLKKLSHQKEVIENSGVNLIIINVGESFQEVKKYVSSNNIPFEILMDKTSQAAGDYGVVGIPAFFFLDQEGVVVEAGNSLPKQYKQILKGLAL